MLPVSDPPRRVGRFRHLIQLLATDKRNHLVFHPVDVKDGTLRVRRVDHTNGDGGDFGRVVVGIVAAEKTASDEGCRARVDGGLKNDTADGNGRLFVNGDFGLVFPPQMGGDQTCRDAPH